MRLKKAWGRTRSYIYRCQCFLLIEPVTCILFLVLCIAPVGLFINFLNSAVSSIPDPNHSVSIFGESQPYIVSIYMAVAACLLAIVLSSFHSGYFWRNLSRWIKQIIQPLALGAGIGLILVSFYLYLVSKADYGTISYDTLMATALGMYLTACALFVGFHGVFLEKVPILNIESLMESLARDIEDCTYRVFWSFPGLSFGSITVGGGLYNRFHEALIHKMESADYQTTVLVLSKEDITNFYEPYINSASTIDNVTERNFIEDAIAKAIQDSHALINIAETTEQLPCFNRGGCKVNFVKPNFHHQIIIIDNAIYFLNSLGLPRYINGGWMFTSKAPVNFVCTRVNSGALATEICRLILEEYDVIYRSKGR